MSEGQMWNYLRGLLKEHMVKVERITDRLLSGFPDTIWLHPSGDVGLLELKYAQPWEWEKRPVIDWRPGQALYLWSWARAGGAGTGRAACLLRIGKSEWRVFVPSPDPDWVERVQGREPPAARVWVGGLDVDELVAILRAASYSLTAG